MTDALTVPAHVPPHLVFDFDIYADPRVGEDVQASYAAAIDAAPDVFWTPRNGGHWVVLPYQAQLDAFRNWEVFSSEHFSPEEYDACLLYTSPSPRDGLLSRMPSSA